MSDAREGLRQLGAILAAFGLALLVWEISAARTVTGYVSARLFMLLVPVAAVSWAVLRLLRWRYPFARAKALTTVLETTSAAATLCFILFMFVAAFHDPRMPTFATTMKSDLRHLVTLQEDSLKASGRFVTRFDSSAYSRNVRPGEIRLTADGWSATVSHTVSPQVCTIFIGTTPVAPATTAGEPACTPLSRQRRTGLMALYAAVIVAGLTLSLLPARPLPPVQPLHTT